MTEMPELLKFPRTPHIVGSSIQVGDDRAITRLSDLVGRGDITLTEKIDGKNTGFRFSSGGDLLIQNRGAYIDMASIPSGPDNSLGLFAKWLEIYEDDFLGVIEDRYIIYGEWMATLHSVFYDGLPGYFLEYDVFDTRDGVFLSTNRRQELLRGLPIDSVPRLFHGTSLTMDELISMAGPSHFRSAPSELIDNLRHACGMASDNFQERLGKLDGSDDMEGVYIRIENDNSVVFRAKWVRPGFTQAIAASSEHWSKRFPVCNLLAKPVPGYPPHLVRAARGTDDVEYSSESPGAWKAWLRDPSNTMRPRY